MGKYDQYKESVFTHEEMQPMIIETDMTDIVEQLRGKVPMVWEDEGFMVVDEDAVLATFTEAADEIERLRTENQELKLQYLSDQGQWIEETGRLRVALERKQRPEAETIDGVIAWIKEDAERLAKARTALVEKE